MNQLGFDIEASGINRPSPLPLAAGTAGSSESYSVAETRRIGERFGGPGPVKEKKHFLRRGFVFETDRWWWWWWDAGVVWFWKMKWGLNWSFWSLCPIHLIWLCNLVLQFTSRIWEFTTVAVRQAFGGPCSRYCFDRALLPSSRILLLQATDVLTS